MVQMPLGIFFLGFCASPTVTPTSSLPMKANVATDQRQTRRHELPITMTDLVN